MDKSISHVLQRQYGGQASAEIVIAWLNHTQNRHANTRVVKLIDLLRELVEIESPSDNKPAVDRIAAFLASKFKALGGRTH